METGNGFYGRFRLENRKKTDKNVHICVLWQKHRHTPFKIVFLMEINSDKW
jgi:hypothetical protein